MPAFAVIMSFIKEYWMYILGAIGILLIVRKLNIGTRKNVVSEYSIQGATITPTQGLALAERLHGAMAPFGTDESILDSVYNSLKQYPLNLRVVYNSFGLRPYGQFGEPAGFWSPSTNADLFQWLKWELSGSQLTKWNSLFNAAGII